MNKRITLIHRGINVSGIAAEIAAAPELWNQHDARRAGDSPHRQLDDIWVRWAPPGVDSSKDHDAVWYPGIREKLPSVIVASHAIMSSFQGERLCGVLLTRIPPGKQCFPHKDGGWHAGYTQKFALQIEAAPGQKFCFDNEELETMPGDLFWFDNLHTHWVTNPTDSPRVTLIVCIKTDWRPSCLMAL